MESKIALQQTAIDGVPCVHAETGDGLDTLCVMFRVGVADESFARVGLTHLVEHLALNTIGPQPYHWNGTVGMTQCLFHATGRPEELVDFAEKVCRAIGSLPGDRLARERQILRTETRSNPKGAREHLLFLRFGAARHGLAWIYEWALATAAMEEVQAWADDRFHRSNAVIWYAGRPLGTLRLPLGDGRSVPPVEPVPIDPLPLPSVLTGRAGVIALGAVGRRTSALKHAVAIATERTMEHLRLERGIARDVRVDYSPISADLGHVIWLIPVLDEHAESVWTGFRAVLQQLIDEGPGDDALRVSKERERRAESGPDGVRSLLNWEAYRLLLGQRMCSQEEVVSEREAVTPSMIQSALAELLDSAILMLPPNVQWPSSGFKEYPIWSAGAVDGGRIYAPARDAGQGLGHRLMARMHLSRSKWPRLVIGPEGVSFHRSPTQRITVHADRCAGMICKGDEWRIVVGLDGFEVRLTGLEWKNGSEAIRDLDGIVPASRRIELRE